MGNETVVWWQIYSSSSYLFVQLGYYLAAYSSVLMSKIITLWQSLFKLQCIMLWLLFKTQCIKKMLYVNLRNLFPIPPSTPRHRAASIRAHPHQFTSIAGACFAASRRTVISCNCGWPQWLDLLAPETDRWPLTAVVNSATTWRLVFPRDASVFVGLVIRHGCIQSEKEGRQQCI